MERYESPTIEQVGMEKDIQWTLHEENILVIDVIVIYIIAAGVIQGVHL